MLKDIRAILRNRNRKKRRDNRRDKIGLVNKYLK